MEGLSSACQTTSRVGIHETKVDKHFREENCHASVYGGVAVNLMLAGVPHPETYGDLRMLGFRGLHLTTVPKLHARHRG